MKSCKDDVRAVLSSGWMGDTVLLLGINDALLVIADKLDKIEAALVSMERK